MTSKLHDARKLFAAAVVIAFLATTISALAINEAGQRAVEAPKSPCQFDCFKTNMLLLELGTYPTLTSRGQALCVLRGLSGMLDADDYFLVAYSALNLSFFLFLAVIGRARPAFVWILAGLLLATVMLNADYLENQYLRHWINQAIAGVPAKPLRIPPAPLHLATATTVKWAAISAASALLGLIYLFHPRPSARLIALPAFTAAALLAFGLYKSCPHWVTLGSTVLFIPWLTILIHAVIVVIEPSQPRR